MKSKVIIVGAGAAGMCAAIIAAHQVAAVVVAVHADGVVADFFCQPPFQRL